MPSIWEPTSATITTKGQPAAVNSYAVYATNSNEISALDRKTGREMWKMELGTRPTSSSTAVDEEQVMIRLESGKLVTFDAKTGAEKWNIQSNERVSSHPILAGRVAAFGSEDHKLYMGTVDKAKLLWRFALGGPIVAPIGKHGVRTLLVPSSDKSIYSVDLFTGQSNWTLATGASVEQEPLVSGNDVYVVNTEGSLAAIEDIPSGTG